MKYPEITIAGQCGPVDEMLKAVLNQDVIPEPAHLYSTAPWIDRNGVSQNVRILFSSATPPEIDLYLQSRITCHFDRLTQNTIELIDRLIKEAVDETIDPNTLQPSAVNELNLTDDEIRIAIIHYLSLPYVDIYRSRCHKQEYYGEVYREPIIRNGVDVAGLEITLGNSVVKQPIDMILTRAPEGEVVAEVLSQVEMLPVSSIICSYKSNYMLNAAARANTAWQWKIS